MRVRGFLYIETERKGSCGTNEFSIIVIIHHIYIDRGIEGLQRKKRGLFGIISKEIESVEYQSILNDE